MTHICVRLITLLLGLPQGYNDLFFIRLYSPIKALSYSGHQAGTSVSYEYISFLVQNIQIPIHFSKTYFCVRRVLCIVAYSGYSVSIHKVHTLQCGHVQLCDMLISNPLVTPIHN